MNKLHEFEDWVKTRWGARKKYGEAHDRQVTIAGLGIAGEAGEVVEHIKKYIRDGKVPNREKLTYELGDVLHYLTRIGIEFHITLEEIANANVDKLQRRDKGEKVG